MRSSSSCATPTATRAARLNATEAVLGHVARGKRRGEPVTAAEVAAILERRIAQYDKSGEQHYNVMSALHKSVRGSDPDAALYWFARMVEGGEDLLYVARRVVRMAVEDIGLADPRGLSVALAAKDAYRLLGLARRRARDRRSDRLSRDGAEIEPRLQCLGRRTSRGARTPRGARAAAHPQCADEAHEGHRLRRGLPLRPCRRRPRGGPRVFARRAARRRAGTSPAAPATRRRSPNGSPGGGSARTRLLKAAAAANDRCPL